MCLSMVSPPTRGWTLDKILTHDDAAIRIRQWPYDEFAPIAAAIDRLMEAQDWARRKAPPAP